MSKNKAIVLVATLVAVVVITFLLVFRDSATIRAVFPFGTKVSLEGGNEPPPGPGRIEGEGLDAGGNLSAANRVGGDVQVRDSRAKGDIELSTQVAGGNPDPKPYLAPASTEGAGASRINLNGVSAGNDLIINQISGYTFEQFRALMTDQRAERQELQDEFTDLKVRLGVTESTLRTFFGILEQEVAAEQWEERLAEIAQRHKQALGRLAALETEDPETRTLLDQAWTAIEVGDYDRAEELLDQAEQRELAGIEEAEELVQGAQAAAERRRLSAAAVRSEQAEVLLIRLRYREAAQRFAAAAELVPASEPKQRLTYLERCADALYLQGDEKGDNAALDAAIRAYRDLLGEYPRERAPLDWARVQNNLGIALWKLGERKAGTARLEEAVTAYRAALQEFTRDRVPLDWAKIQNNLGIALWILGERETDTDRLEEAVAAYRAALQEQTRERVPLDWARTQNNLGGALMRLGERGTGTARLEEAVAAFCAALQERTRERVPLDWAMTQNNLGAALQTLGERETDTGRLEEAVTAYRAALQEFTRDRVPLDWARTQNNLGAALQTLGERETDTGRLEEAVAAHRAALQELTRDRVPLQWVATQNSLGLALLRLGERESGTARLEEAVAIFQATLQEWIRERVPLQWATTQNNLGTVLQTLGKRESDTARLEGAVAAYRAALQEYTRDRVPLDWAMTQNNLGTALGILGERESDSGRLEEARGCIEDAWQVYKDAGMDQYDKDFRERLEAIDRLIETRRAR